MATDLQNLVPSGLEPAEPIDIDRLLTIMTEQEASDLHLKATRPPLMRVHGRLQPLGERPLEPADIEAMVEQILTPQQKNQLQETHAVDLGYGVQGLARFRGNIYRQRGSLALCFRRIPFEVLGIEALELPEVLEEFTSLPMGLVLVTGPTGSGKSTTLAALMRYIADQHPVHLITIEDPIEFLFADSVASVSQREVGTDTGSFSEALRNAMRQDPDVIMVGEMRDPETVSTVISAAETGHLVFSTLHTNSATQTIDRILDTFPGNQQKQVRAQLGSVLKGVVSIQLVERADGSGRVAALEIMRASPRICEMVEKGETAGLHEELESSVAYYRMQSMNQSLLSLLVHNTISYSEAMRQSPDPEDLLLKLRKMFPDLEQQGGPMSPTTSDFSKILELQQYQKLYEEQEEKVKLQISEKDQEIDRLAREIEESSRQQEQMRAQIQEANGRIEQSRADYDRLRQEAQEKIDKLSARIKELNQRIMANA